MMCVKKLRKQNEKLLATILGIQKSLEWSVNPDNRPVNEYYGQLFAHDIKIVLVTINNLLEKEFNIKKENPFNK